MTRIMGILNLTPDSFSGDGRYGSTVNDVLAKIDRMLEEGADIIDIGAESTRPGAVKLSAEEEWQRLAGLVAQLGTRMANAIFSLDTYHPENAQRALEAGFSWINDVSGGTPEMLRLLASHSHATLVLMHSLGIPADPTVTLAPHDDAVHKVAQWGRQAIMHANAAGIATKKLVLDPGIGFGKTAAQSLELIRSVASFRDWGVPVLIGHSRKSFLKNVLGDASDRDAATLALSLLLVQQGVDILRVHDVAAHTAMLKCWKAYHEAS